MLGLLINKELKGIVQSPRFVGSFVVCSILILLSIYAGIREYRVMADRYDAGTSMVDQELRQETSWGRMTTTVYRKPDPMQIFASGLDYDIGRWSSVSSNEGVKLKNSAYSDDPIYALFRFIDFTFITTFILTLFAILFTYNAINGEREDGTLKLVMANSVSRAKYLIGKAVGAWLGLVIPVSIPILIGLLMIVLFGVPLTGAFWTKTIILLMISLGLFTFFIFLGLLISSVTRSSSVSFLLSLVVWVALVMIIPRAGIMAAGHLVEVPRVAEIEGQLDGYSKNLWDEFTKVSQQRWRNFEADNREGEGVNWDDEKMWAMMEIEDSLRHEVEKNISDHELKLKEDLRQRKISQEKLAFTLSRFSPVSAYQLGAIQLAGTDAGMKTRYEDAILNYRDKFSEHVRQKQEETGDQGRIMLALTVDDNGAQNMQISGDRSKETLDISGVPKFEPPSINLTESTEPIVVDFGIIVLCTILAFGGAFVSFLRYDVR